MTLTTYAPCTILVTARTASARIAAAAMEANADWCDVRAFRCLRCGLSWEAELCVEWRTTTCSNCYSERVVITLLRLSFDNWGEHNGGEPAQRARWECAKAKWDRVRDVYLFSAGLKS